jgi:hypothetical protein
MYPSAIRQCLRFEKWARVTIGHDAFLPSNGREFENGHEFDKAKTGRRKTDVKTVKYLDLEAVQNPGLERFATSGAR